MSKMGTRADRIERGMTLFDDKMPGWIDKIDLDRLDQADGEACVVGQTHREEGSRYGRYWAGLEALGLADHLFTASTTASTVAAAYGFETRDGRESYDALTRAWRAAIKRRQAAS